MSPQPKSESMSAVWLNAGGSCSDGMFWVSCAGGKELMVVRREVSWAVLYTLIKQDLRTGTVGGTYQWIFNRYVLYQWG